MTAEFIIISVICMVALVINFVADRIITNHRLKINQRAWDEYSKDMTRKQKEDVFIEWIDEQQKKHGWRYKYIPRI